ncbi:MAG: hypothetical protein JXQ75_14530, partial [Phycisphaerae bacterium]|nr:hypothetical protein [Phycisphaerae bacterium]
WQNCGTGVSPVVFTVRNGFSERLFSLLPHAAIPTTSNRHDSACRLADARGPLRRLAGAHALQPRTIATTRLAVWRMPAVGSAVWRTPRPPSIIRFMVIAHHLILTGYGHWLPNDPRGSLSKEIRAGKLFPLGPIHYGRKEVQPAQSELRSFHEQARPRLEHEVVWFDAAKRQAITEAFSDTIRDRRYTCWACAVLSNHAHLVIRRHRDRAETMHDELRRNSAARLCRLADLSNDHPIWSNDKFKKFLSTPEDIERTIQYVQDNPAREGLPPQQYDFVRPYRSDWSIRR